MDENRARRVAEALRALGIEAQLKRAGVYQFGVAVALPGGREAVWDTDGSAAAAAQVMANGMLVGYVARIELVTADGADDAQLVEAIARTDYAQPVGRRSTVAAVKAAPLPASGGVFRRLVEGFRDH